MKLLTTTIQEHKGKYSTAIPISIIALLKLEKGDTLKWGLEEGQIYLEVPR